MANTDRILAVDAGNTRVKWALWETGGFVREGWCGVNALEQLAAEWRALARPDRTIIANVAGDNVAGKLTQACGQWNMTPVWVGGTHAQCGVTNSYDDPSQLGPDRWAALIGAHALSVGHCVVVCMGTATTVNALTSDGVFLGGMILPGYDMMHDMLSSRTALLGAQRGQVVAFPRSTADAITAGAVRATCGAIEFMYEEMLRSGRERVVILATGGAATMFGAACKYPVSVHERLVLEGLVRIGIDHSSGAAGQAAGA